MEITVLYQSDFLEVTLDHDNQWLYADWRGRHHDESIKEGINQLISLMIEHRVFKILNDSTHMQGIWLGVAGWLIHDALPRARKAGLHTFAHVFGPSRFSSISAEAALLLLDKGTVDIKAFEDLTSAAAWLQGR